MARRGFLAAALVVACGALLVAPALAGTASGGSKDLSYKAWPGEANHVSLSWDATRVTVSDTGALLVLGCLPLGLNKVSCPRPDGPASSGCDAACHANVALGDGNDWGVIDNAPVSGGLSVLLDGGAGNDFLIANRGAISGGAGDDTLVAVTGVAGHVDFVCGPGEDYATARPGDSVAADCEHVARPAGARRAATARAGF
jgi:Ca2+-binding RTX toxin-like protein